MVVGVAVGVGLGLTAAWTIATAAVKPAGCRERWILSGHDAGLIAAGRLLLADGSNKLGMSVNRISARVAARVTLVERKDQRWIWCAE